MTDLRRFISHLVIAHKDYRPDFIVCNECDRKFKIPIDLKRHFKRNGRCNPYKIKGMFTIKIAFSLDKFFVNLFVKLACCIVKL